MSPVSLERIEREILAYEALLAAVARLPGGRRSGDEADALVAVEAALKKWRAS